MVGMRIAEYKPVEVSTWTLKGDSRAGCEDYVLGLVDTIPDVILTTVHIKRGWFRFYWKFTLRGSPIYVLFVSNEISRMVESYNTQLDL